MIIKNVALETVCGITSTLPENIHPEVAFAGKSNVGKSSLINALMNRKSWREPVLSRARRRQSITIILMMPSILWICRDMALHMSASR